MKRLHLRPWGTHLWLHLYTTCMEIDVRLVAIQRSGQLLILWMQRYAMVCVYACVCMWHVSSWVGQLNFVYTLLERLIQVTEPHSASLPPLPGSDNLDTQIYTWAQNWMPVTNGWCHGDSLSPSTDISACITYENTSSGSTVPFFMVHPRAFLLWRT